VASLDWAASFQKHVVHFNILEVEMVNNGGPIKYVVIALLGSVMVVIAPYARSIALLSIGTFAIVFGLVRAAMMRLSS